MTSRLRIRAHGGMFTAEQIAALADLADQAQAVARIDRGGGFALSAAPPPAVIAGLSRVGLRGRTGTGFGPGVLGPAMAGRTTADLRALTTGLERDLAAVTIPRGEQLVVVDEAGRPTPAAAHVRVVVGDDRIRVRADGGAIDTVVPADPAGSRYALPRVVARMLRTDPPPIADPAADVEVPVGWLAHDDHVSLGAAVDDGVLDARRLAFLAAIDRPVTITQWRTLIVHDMTEGTAEQVVRVLAPMGFVFDAASPAVPSPITD